MWDFALGLMVAVSVAALVANWPPDESFAAGGMCGIASMVLLLRVFMWVDKHAKERKAAKR